MELKEARAQLKKEIMEIEKKLREIDIKMNDSQKYLKARNDIKDFYQVVWQQSLRKTIKELAEKIKVYNSDIYDELDGALYDASINVEDDRSTLGLLMQSLFDHIKPLEYDEETNEPKKLTKSELYEQEKAVLFGMMPAFTGIFNKIYAALLKT